MSDREISLLLISMLITVALLLWGAIYMIDNYVLSATHLPLDVKATAGAVWTPAFASGQWASSRIS